jgi:hypothetical protein
MAMKMEDAIAAVRANYPTENYTMLREALDFLIERAKKPESDALSLCVNKQAEEIEDLKTKINDNQIIASHRYQELQYVCDDQAKEIERLRSELAECHSRDLEVAGFLADKAKQAKRIEELENTNRELIKNWQSWRNSTKEQETKALIKEVIGQLKSGGLL